MATTKKKVIGKVTEAEANKALAQHAEADSRIQKINAEIELKIQKIREDKAADLSAYQDKVDETLDILHAFAEQNADLFAKKRSYDMTHGTIGYRLGNFKVEIGKGMTAKVVVGLMQNIKMLKPYVAEKTTLSIDKDALIDARENEKLMEKLAEVKVSVVQDETFYVEPKKEAV